MTYQTIAAQSLSTPDLLAMLVGKDKAQALSHTSLSVLFGMRANRQTTVVCEKQPHYAPAAIISAAKELVMRALSKTQSTSIIVRQHKLASDSR